MSYNFQFCLSPCPDSYRDGEGLNFFKPVNEFVKKDKANNACQVKDQCKHSFNFYRKNNLNFTIMSKAFYITTTLPYVNAEPHVGFAMEIIRADVIARYKKQEGYEVFFNTGTDEHGKKLWEAAQKENREIQEYLDEYAEKFRGLKGLLDISDDIHFIRTTDSNHIVAAQEFWSICLSNGYIYKKTYKAKYCVGCELNKTDSELNEQGECPLHIGRPLELIDEENYFFKFSAICNSSS